MSFSARASDPSRDDVTSRAGIQKKPCECAADSRNTIWHQLATSTRTSADSATVQEEVSSALNAEEELESQPTSENTVAQAGDTNSMPGLPLNSCPPSPTPKNSSVKAIVKPQHDFPGRSYSQFGVGEKVNLSFEAPQSKHLPKDKQAEFHGGLQWFKVSGPGTLTNGKKIYDGNATYTANGEAKKAELELRVAAQGCKDAVVAKKTIDVVLPNKGYMVMQAGNEIWHCKGYWSVGFCGLTYFKPADVSFGNAEFQEGEAIASASGFLDLRNGQKHHAGSCSKPGSKSKDDWCPMEAPTMSGIGTRAIARDNVKSGKEAPNPNPSNGQKWGKGEFTWNIPWRIKWGNGHEHEVMKAKHYTTSDEKGTAYIEKEGPKFEREVDQPSDKNCPARKGPCG